MFSQFARKLLFSGKNNEMYLQHFICNFLHTLFPTLSTIFANVLIICLWGGDFMTFEFLWPTTISPRNASLGSSQRRKMVKAYSPIMLKLLADSWCAERSFPKKTIPSGCLGEYKCCCVILSHWIHILVIISSIQSFYVP